MSFPGFRMDNTRACFHAGGKYWLRKATLNTFVRTVMARLVRCLRSLFGIQFGPRDLPALSLLMACGTSERLVNVDARKPCARNRFEKWEPGSQRRTFAEPVGRDMRIG
jgi:hypothetical protein